MERSTSPRYAAIVVGEIRQTLWHSSNHPSGGSATAWFAHFDRGPALAGHWVTEPAFAAGQRAPADVNLELKTVASGRSRVTAQLPVMPFCQRKNGRDVIGRASKAIRL
jgi:hypothetical protein